MGTQIPLGEVESLEVALNDPKNTEHPSRDKRIFTKRRIKSRWNKERIYSGHEKRFKKDRYSLDYIYHLKHTYYHNIGKKIYHDPHGVQFNGLSGL